MARGNGGVGKTIALLFLIIILVLGGLLWFNYLGVIRASTVQKFAAPVYKLLGKQPRTSETATKGNPFTGDLDEDRFAKRIESLSSREQELDKREEDVKKQEEQIGAVAKELEERRKSQDERESTFNSQQKQLASRDANIEQISIYLSSMPPQTAVAQLVAMDDQDIIDILRKTDAIAAANRTASLTSVWLMNMPAERAAVVSSKMANKPDSLENK